MRATCRRRPPASSQACAGIAACAMPQRQRHCAVSDCRQAAMQSAATQPAAAIRRGRPVTHASNCRRRQHPRRCPCGQQRRWPRHAHGHDACGRTYQWRRLRREPAETLSGCAAAPGPAGRGPVTVAHLHGPGCCGPGRVSRRGGIVPVDSEGFATSGSRRPLPAGTATSCSERHEAAFVWPGSAPAVMHQVNTGIWTNRPFH